MYLFSHMCAPGCISFPCLACICTCTLSAAGRCVAVCVLQDDRGDALCCEPLKLQGPVEISPELGGEAQQRDVWESSSHLLEEAGCNDTCFARCRFSTGPLWFLPSDAFLCYHLHRVPKTAASFQCLIQC